MLLCPTLLCLPPLKFHVACGCREKEQLPRRNYLSDTFIYLLSINYCSRSHPLVLFEAFPPQLITGIECNCQMIKVEWLAASVSIWECGLVILTSNGKPSRSDGWQYPVSQCRVENCRLLSQPRHDFSANNIWKYFKSRSNFMEQFENSCDSYSGLHLVRQSFNISLFVGFKRKALLYRFFMGLFIVVLERSREKVMSYLYLFLKVCCASVWRNITRL
jgi:hypothetical protein